LCQGRLWVANGDDSSAAAGKKVVFNIMK
jgi:hypothetical protein